MPPVNVALIGYKFMGKVHSHAYHDMPFFFRTGHVPVRKVICGRQEGPLREAAARWGWEEASTDWRRVVERSDIHLIDISAPDVLHHEIAMAAAAAGKHILCEKPLAMTTREAEDMTRAVQQAGVLHMIAHQLRKVPALLYARRLIEEGALGQVLHVRALWTNEMGIDANYPLVWRFRREHVGKRGVLANLGSHLIDLIRFLAGEIVEVAGSASTHIKFRPLPEDGTVRPIPGTRGEVTVFDETCFLARLANGASAVVEASWVAAGHKHGQRIEVNGTEGSLAFGFERMNELEVYFRRDPAPSGGFRRVLVTEPEHPYIAAWWPRGHGIAYEHLFVHMVYEFMDALDRGTLPSPDFHDGLMVNRVMDAVEASIERRGWVPV